ncbi:hypothetical protein NE237_010398 [Protea cynaroides]|uniref:Uncharacterized protein n=1 Tax=Protea cynaroides TaxID=273540 RepID=A0A9Q0R179_9MAGN|nr:hypothetical protein NE237_016350 [Protea cynaroides]KAJ4979618.1 hypothetical protein NE237_010398 [Protea cynaroides]
MYGVRGVEQYPLINSSLREGIHERQAFRRDSIRCYPVRNFLSGSDRGKHSRFRRVLGHSPNKERKRQCSLINKPPLQYNKILFFSLHPLRCSIHCSSRMRG